MHGFESVITASDQPKQHQLESKHGRTDTAVELSCDSALQARSAPNEHVFNAAKRQII